MNFELDYENLKILLKNFIIEVTIRILVLILKNNDASSDLKKQIYDVFDELATSLQKEDAFTDEELEELFRYLWKRDPRTGYYSSHLSDVVNLEDLCLYFVRIYNMKSNEE